MVLRTDMVSLLLEMAPGAHMDGLVGIVRNFIYLFISVSYRDPVLLCGRYESDWFQGAPEGPVNASYPNGDRFEASRL